MAKKLGISQSPTRHAREKSTAGKKSAAKAEQYPMFPVLCRELLGEVPEAEYRFDPVRMWRFDFAFPAYRLAVEVEGGIHTGGRHTRGKGYAGDMEKYNAATVAGWSLIRVQPKELTKTKTFEQLKTIIEKWKENRN